MGSFDRVYFSRECLGSSFSLGGLIRIGSLVSVLGQRIARIRHLDSRTRFCVKLFFSDTVCEIIRKRNTYILSLYHARRLRAVLGSIQLGSSLSVECGSRFGSERFFQWFFAMCLVFD